MKIKGVLCVALLALTSASRGAPPDAESALGASRALDASAQALDSESYGRLISDDYVGKVIGYPSDPMRPVSFTKQELLTMLDEARKINAVYKIARTVESVTPSERQDATIIRGRVVERFDSPRGSATLVSSFSMTFVSRSGRTLLLSSANAMAPD